MRLWGKGVGLVNRTGASEMRDYVIEAVPNVSEGRRPHVLRELADAISGTPGVRLLDSSADPSHNRSVFTMVGDPEGLTDAVLRLFAVAVRRIDLRGHRGVHPRIGAVDVVPFVPLADTAMHICVDLARTVGARVADRFGIPVFWYEQAATDAARRALEGLRRGQYEALADKMATREWRPDCGPAIPHQTAGASAFGARHPLIAFNVNLATDDVEVAREIARRVRARGGGLPFVKALGLRLAHLGLVQVSLNVTDYRRTSLDQAFDAVVREAAALGTTLAGTEIVGLVPADALVTPAARQLQLHGFTRDQVLEVRLRANGGSSPPAGSQ